MTFREYKQKLRGLRKEAHDFEPDPNYNPSEWGEDWCPQCQSPMYWHNGAWACQHCGWRGPAGWNQTPEEPSEMQHPDPWMDNEPGTLQLPEHWGKVGLGAMTNGCPNCGGLRWQAIPPFAQWGDPDAICHQRCKDCGTEWARRVEPLPAPLRGQEGDVTPYEMGDPRDPHPPDPDTGSSGTTLPEHWGAMDPYSHPLAMQLALLKHEQGDHVQPQPGCPACIAESVGLPSQVTEWNGLRPRRSGAENFEDHPLINVVKGIDLNEPAGTNVEMTPGGKMFVNGNRPCPSCGGPAVSTGNSKLMCANGHSYDRVPLCPGCAMQTGMQRGDDWYCPGCKLDYTDYDSMLRQASGEEST